MLSACGTFVAIAKGILTTQSNPVTGEPLVDIAQEHATDLRKLLYKYWATLK